MTWRMVPPFMVGPVADWTSCSWGRAGALRVSFQLSMWAARPPDSSGNVDFIGGIYIKGVVNKPLSSVFYTNMCN